MYLFLVKTELNAIGGIIYADFNILKNKNNVNGRDDSFLY